MLFADLILSVSEFQRVVEVTEKYLLPILISSRFWQQNEYENLMTELAWPFCRKEHLKVNFNVDSMAWGMVD